MEPQTPHSGRIRWIVAGCFLVIIATLVVGWFFLKTERREQDASSPEDAIVSAGADVPESSVDTQSEKTAPNPLEGIYNNPFE